MQHNESIALLYDTTPAGSYLRPWVVDDSCWSDIRSTTSSVSDPRIGKVGAFWLTYFPSTGAAVRLRELGTCLLHASLPSTAVPAPLLSSACAESGPHTHAHTPRSCWLRRAHSDLSGWLHQAQLGGQLPQQWNRHGAGQAARDGRR